MQIDQIRCSEHPSEFISNFCAKEGCLVGLCATCICKHTEYHNRLGSNPEYENIKDTFVSIEDKLTKYWGSLQHEKSRLNNLVEYIDKSKKQIKILILSAKDDVFASIEKCFQEIEVSFETQMEIQKEKAGYHVPQRFQHIFSDVNQQLNELKVISEDLHSLKFPHIIKIIKGSFLPKGEAFLNQISKQISKNELFTPEVSYNPNLFNELTKNIKSMINLSFKFPMNDQPINSTRLFQKPVFMKRTSKTPVKMYQTTHTSPITRRTMDLAESIWTSNQQSRVSPITQSRNTLKSPLTPRTSRNWCGKINHERL